MIWILPQKAVICSPKLTNINSADTLKTSVSALFSNIKQVVDALKEVNEMGGDYDDIVEILQRMGRIASERK